MESVPKEEKAEKDGEILLECMRKLVGINQKVKLPDLPINKKIQKKYLNELPFASIIETNILPTTIPGDKKELKKEIIFPSGIKKIILKNEKNQIIEEKIDYSNMKEKALNKIKNNIGEELEILVGNAFLLYNRKSFITKIVKKPISTKTLTEKMLIWKYYVKDLTNKEKAELVRKLLFYIEKFSRDCYKEFLNIEHISNAYLLMYLNKKVDANDDRGKKCYLINKFYMMNSIIGVDEVGNPEKKTLAFQDEANAILFLSSNYLDIKEELNGTGFGYKFLKELKNIGDMYFHSSLIFDSVFQECFNIFQKNIIDNKFQFFRVLLNYFSNNFIENTFVINFLIQLKYLFGVYKQYEVIKYMHRIVLSKFNTFQSLENIKNELINLIGPEEELDDSAKVEKMENIDDLLKYIKGEQKPKKKKKKKKNKNPINQLDNLLNKKNEEIDNEEDSFDDGVSIISEADSIVDCFKNDIMAETEFNTGNKPKPSLSIGFMNKFE